MSIWYDGALPSSSPFPPAGQTYSPMRLEGSIVLGAGGDNSNAGTGSFFEGVMTSGFSSDTVDNQVQANIAAQNYDGASSGSGPGSTITHGGKCVDVSGHDRGGNLRPVDISDCESMAADQHWEGSAYGIHTLGTMSRCMDSAGNGTANGTKVELYDCNGVDVQGNDLARPLQAVQTFSCYTIVTQEAEAQDQKWTYHPAQQTLTSQGLCLDIDGNATANFSKLEVFTCNSVGGQVWQFRGDSTVFNPQSGRCLDINQGLHDAEVLQIYDCVGGDAQHFTMN